MNYPKYQSHKEVSAAKITAVDAGADGSLTLHLEEPFDNVIIQHQQMKHKPKPEVGWYLVVYADGFMSFSPAKAFEEGYTRVEAESVASDDPETSDRGDGNVGQKDDDEDEKQEEESENEAVASGAVPIPS